MSCRRHRRAVVVLTCFAAVGLGVFAAVDAVPSWQASRAYQISTLQAGEQASMAAPDRRVSRSSSPLLVDRLLGLSLGPAGGATALIAAAGTVLVASSDRLFSRIRRFLAFTLRSPPVPAHALVPVR